VEKVKNEINFFNIKKQKKKQKGKYLVIINGLESNYSPKCINKKRISLKI